MMKSQSTLLGISPARITGTLVAIVLAAGCLEIGMADEQSTKSAAGSELSIWEALVLGVVEGATEYLPVSSTGHLILVQDALGVGGEEESSTAAKALAICIQSGAILAVLVLYFARIQEILRGLLGRDRNGLILLRNLIVAFLPAAVIGLLFNDWIKEHLFGVRPVAAALIVGGLLILSVAGRIARKTHGHEIHNLSVKDAVLIGVMQCLAFWPGFSRSLATILGCLWAGLALSAAVEFSFLLGLVTLSAATVYEGAKHGGDMIAVYGIVSPLIALVAAFVSAVISVRFMVSILQGYGLAPFGYYRILLGLMCLILL